MPATLPLLPWTMVTFNDTLRCSSSLHCSDSLPCRTPAFTPIASVVLPLAPRS